MVKVGACTSSGKPCWGQDPRKYRRVQRGFPTNPRKGRNEKGRGSKGNRALQVVRNTPGKGKKVRASEEGDYRVEKDRKPKGKTDLPAASLPTSHLRGGYQ